ncbi:MAG: hypothetical protein GF341_01690 [candidate division Zixibacteria bacterium]|nr:hypothetical protein [candidate division Zixibacteria bacterium]
MNVSLFRTFSFDAAHENRSAQATERTGRLHGHTYEATVWVSGELDQHLGWLIDFADVKSNCKPIIDQLDHRLLNDIDGINDSSLADVRHWLESRLAPVQPGFKRCEISIVGDRRYAPKQEDRGELITVHFGLEAAHYLPHLPPTHKCRRMHGHSYMLDILTADTERTIAAAGSIYSLLDHTSLNDIDGLSNPTAEMLARWVWRRLQSENVSIQEVGVRETCMMGCVYRGEDE